MDECYDFEIGIGCKLADAIRYALSLTRFIDDGCINHTVERSIRPIALNRKMRCLRARTAAPTLGPPSLP